MKRRRSSSQNSTETSNNNKRGSKEDEIRNIRTKPLKIYDNITRRLLQFGITLAIITFIGLIVRYAVQEFDPSISTISVTTSRVNNRDIASLSVSKNFLERLLEFTEESIAIVAAIIPIGFPLCTIFNRHFAKIRANGDKIEVINSKVLDMIPKYVVIGDAQACQLPNGSQRLRPLVRDTIYQLIKVQLKPKLIVEDSYEEARKLGIRIGLIRREHHKLAVIKSVDLLRNITDSRGDIKEEKVRYLLSRMKIMSQSTPADKSLLVYLMKHCESMPNENLAYLGYSFTDPEAMKLADCAISFQDCDDEDVKREAQVILKSDSMTFTDLYLLMIVCLLSSNVIQSYALYQISASVSSCLYRFLSITVFQEQLISRSQFALLMLIQQVFAILALMTKWFSSLPQSPLRSPVAEMSHAATEDSLLRQKSHSAFSSPRNQHHSPYKSSLSLAGGQQQQQQQQQHHHHHHHHQRKASISIRMAADEAKITRGLHQHDNLTSSSELETSSDAEDLWTSGDANSNADHAGTRHKRNHLLKHQQQSRKYSTSTSAANATVTGTGSANVNHHHHIHLSGIDLDEAVINSSLVTSYKQTFHNSLLIDDVTYRLVKLHITYQVLVMMIIMIFGNAMFQLNVNNNRQHQTLAFNSLMMNSIFNLANCFNQFGQFNLRAGFRSHPFFVCVLLMAVFVQVSLTELNAFGLENMNPIQWFVCFVFALLSALMAPLTGQQQRQRPAKHCQVSPQPALSGQQQHLPLSSALASSKQSTHQHQHQHPRAAGSAAQETQPNKHRKQQQARRSKAGSRKTTD